MLHFQYLACLQLRPHKSPQSDHIFECYRTYALSTNPMAIRRSLQVLPLVLQVRGCGVTSGGPKNRFQAQKWPKFNLG